MNVLRVPCCWGALQSPPVLSAITDGPEFSCGTCDTVLLLAEPGQIHGVVIACAVCGSFNATDGAPPCADIPHRRKVSR
jgi:hypothetical protein